MYQSWLLVAMVLAVRAQAEVDSPYCSTRYRRLCQGKGRHVACQFPFPGPGPSCVNYTMIPFGPELRHFITHYINRRRQRIASGNERVRGGIHIPRPEIMMQVEWDRELANLAQRLADQCSFVHDDCRATIRYWFAGQTVGEVKWRRTSDSEERDAARAIRKVLDAWWGEKRRVTVPEIIRPFRLNSKGTVWGHFSQIAVWSLRGVGCGAVRHGATYPKMLLVCDFSHTNMLGQRTITPGPLAACPIHTIRHSRSMYPLLCSPVRHPVIEYPDSVNQSNKPNEEFEFVYDTNYDDGEHISDDQYDNHRPNAIANSGEIAKQKAELIIKARNRLKMKEKATQKVVFKEFPHGITNPIENDDFREPESKHEAIGEEENNDTSENRDGGNLPGKEHVGDKERKYNNDGLYNSERERDRNRDSDQIRVLDRGGVINPRLKADERVGAYDKTRVLSGSDREKELEKLRVLNRIKTYNKDKVPERELAPDSLINNKDRSYKNEENVIDENRIAQKRLRPNSDRFVERERANEKIGQSIYQKAMDDRKMTSEEKEAMIAINKKYPNERDRVYDREEILQRGRFHTSTTQNNRDEVKIGYYIKPLHGKQNYNGVTQSQEHNQDHLRVRPASFERDKNRYYQDDTLRRDRFKNKDYLRRDPTRVPKDFKKEQRNRFTLTLTPTRPMSSPQTEALANFGVVFYEPVKRRWRPTRDRPDRPGAKALLVNTMPVESGRTAFHLSTKPVAGLLKMDKDDVEQFFKDTGYNPLWKINKQVSSTIRR